MQTHHFCWEAEDSLGFAHPTATIFAFTIERPEQKSGPQKQHKKRSFNCCLKAKEGSSLLIILWIGEDQLAWWCRWKRAMLPFRLNSQVDLTRWLSQLRFTRPWSHRMGLVRWAAALNLSIEPLSGGPVYPFWCTWYVIFRMDSCVIQVSL